MPRISNAPERCQSDAVTKISYPSPGAGRSSFGSIFGNPNPAINGSEVYVYRENSTAYDLGVNVLESIVDLVGTRYNQVRTNPSLYVLRRTSMPAILVELAYLSNLQDAEKLLNDQYLFAFSIYIGILNYLGYSYDPFPRR